MPSTLLLLKSPSSTFPPSSTLHVSHLPLLETSFNSVSLSQLSQLFSSRGNGTDRCDFDGIIFCSQRAVKAFEEASRGGQLSRRTRRIPHFVVGQQTRQALLNLYSGVTEGEEEEGPEVLGEGSGNGEQLAQAIISHFNQRGEDEKRHLLFLSGDKGTEILPKVLAELTGGRIDLVKLQVYATQVVEGFEDKFMEYLMDQQKKQRSTNGCHQDSGSQWIWIGICSPSGGKQVVNILRNQSLLSFEAPPSPAMNPRDGLDDEAEVKTTIRRRIRFVAIGSTTKDYLENEEGVKVDAIAKVPGEEGMIKAVLEAEALEKQEG